MGEWLNGRKGIQLVLPGFTGRPRLGTLSRDAWSGDLTYKQWVGGDKGPFFGFTWLYPDQFPKSSVGRFKG